MVYGTAHARRYQPLPDLFAHHLPKKTMEEQVPSVGVPGHTTSEKKEEKKKEKPLPKVCGIVQNGSQRLVFLQYHTETNVYGVGDVLDVYRIVYINEAAVGLQQEESIIEIPLS